jgi:uncharacterized protein (DUF433 family)
MGNRRILDLVEVLQTLHAKGMSIEDLVATSGLSEKDVKAVIRKSEKLIRTKREDAIRKLKNIYLKLQGDSYLIALS